VVGREGRWTVSQLTHVPALVSQRWSARDVPGDAVPRREAVAHVRETLAAGRSAVIVGEAGVGKTHLVTSVLARLRHVDESGVGEHPVVTLSASGRDDIPLAALEPLLGDDGLLTLGSFARTTEALAASLERRGPVVLRVEDAHLLDDASARALAWLVRQRDVVLVATLRSAALPGSPWFSLWRDGAVERVDVAPFTRAEVERWLGAALGGPVAPDAVRRLWHATGGNAFHLAETVRAERASGTLRIAGGAWTWDGRATPGPRLLDLVAHEVDLLTAAGRAALEVAALAGPIPLSLYLDEVPRAALDELVRHGLVALAPCRSTSGGSEVVVDVPHGLYAEALSAVVPRARRRALVERFLVLPGAPRRGEALVRMVTLALGTGVDVPHHKLLGAVDAAFALGRPQTVVDLVTSALVHRPADDERRPELLLHRADAWWHLDRGLRALQDLDELDAALHAHPVLTDPLARVLVAAAAMRAGVVHHRADDVAAAVAVLDAARDRLVVAGAHPDRLTSLEVARLARLGYGGEVSALDAALAALASPVDVDGAVRLASPTAVGLTQVGRFAAAADVVRRYEAPARLRADRYRWGAGEIGVAAFLAALLAGDVDAARAVATRAEADADADADVPPPLDGVAGHVSLGLLAMADGAWSQACVELHAANARLARGDLSGVGAFSHAAGALATAANGSGLEARALLASAGALPLRSAAVLGFEVRLMRVDTLGWLRDERAVPEAAALAASARERGLARIELEALHRLLERTRTTLDRAAVARVAELGSVVEGPRAAAITARVAALACGDQDLARIAERELNRCGLWLPPVAVPIALTPREGEIAALAAGGMTSRAIANRLTLSVRTVDSHLARVFAKTGVHSREELASALR